MFFSVANYQLSLINEVNSAEVFDNVKFSVHVAVAYYPERFNFILAYKLSQCSRKRVQQLKKT